MIEIDNLTKIFHSDKNNVVALREIALKLSDNRFVLVKGPSGCGKSTLLFSLGGLLKPSSGTIKVLDKNLYNISDKERGVFISKNIGFVFQSYHLIPYLNVMENILFPNKTGHNGITKTDAEAIANRLGLSDRLNHRPKELSVGEKQRVALARALITNPKILLADEPTGNLDPQNTDEVLNHLNQFRKSGGSVIMVSHGNEADDLSDTTVHLNKGRLTNIESK